MADKENNADLIDCTILKERRVVRSALEAETFGLADACDAAIIIRYDLKMILSTTIKVILLTDSDILFKLIISNEPTTENIILIYI